MIEDTYNSFNKLLRELEGKNILIDVWATWCGPCVADFKKKGAILPFIKNDDIEVLYISIDKPEWEDRWLQSMKINQLEGYHYRADAKFIRDMWETLGGPTGEIPRYALVDKTGEIFITAAARPGDKLLVEQIEELIERTKDNK